MKAVVTYNTGVTPYLTIAIILYWWLGDAALEKQSHFLGMQTIWMARDGGVSELPTPTYIQYMYFVSP